MLWLQALAVPGRAIAVVVVVVVVVAVIVMIVVTFVMALGGWISDTDVSAYLYMRGC